MTATPYTFQLGPFALTLTHSPDTTLAARLERLETRMSELTASVDTLKSAVDGVAQRLLPQITALEEALAAAQADDADAAALFAEAEAATAAIRTEVDRLNALGANPETPVDESGPDVDVLPDVDGDETFE